MQPLDRNAALADPSRRALLGELRRAGRAMDVRELATIVGLHPNSAREQLTRLADAGLVRVTLAPAAGRGRPGHRYAAAPTETSEPYRVLVSVLAEQLRDLPDAAGRSAAAGERWGREAAATLPPTSPEGAVDAVIELLAEAGFAPESRPRSLVPGQAAMPEAPATTELRLRACPFLPLDPSNLDVICGVHLGFLRGALRELHAPVDAASIHPFTTPDACSARLEARTDA
jgi:predicted ArsR family transcriptional regulator